MSPAYCHRLYRLQGFSGPLSQKMDEKQRMCAFWREFLNGESRACVDSRHFFVTTDLKIPVRNQDWKRPFNLLADSVSPARASTVIPSTDTSCSHPDAFVMLSGTSAVLCNVLMPSREVWRAKSTLFSRVKYLSSVTILWLTCFDD